jgi:hypothetical protein
MRLCLHPAIHWLGFLVTGIAGDSFVRRGFTGWGRARRGSPGIAGNRHIQQALDLQALGGLDQRHQAVAQHADLPAVHVTEQQLHDPHLHVLEEDDGVEVRRHCGEQRPEVGRAGGQHHSEYRIKVILDA